MIDNCALYIKALGGFSITLGKDEITCFDRARLQELMLFLLMKPGQPLLRSQIAFLFWPETTQKQAFSNLRNLLYYLRQALPNFEQFITIDSQTITWREDSSFWFDVGELKINLGQAAETKSWLTKVNHLEKAVQLYEGELLPGNYSNWLLEERKQLAQTYNSVLSKLVSLYESRRQYQKAIVHAQTLIQHDPLHEPAYAQLMLLHALDENRAAALNTYHSCVTFLRHEMGIEPSHKLLDLYERIINQEKINKNDTLTDVSLPLVGRDKCWKQLQQIWRSSTKQPKFVLIRGEAGIGKTRLAEAFGEWVTHQGGRVLNARCYTTETSLAYAPIITWLRSSPLGHLDSTQLTELYRFLPEIENKHPDLPKPEPITEDWQRLRLFEALECALFAGHKSLMLILDDLQWCDPETLDWLSFLLAASRIGCDQPQLLILAGLRSGNSNIKKIVTDWESTLTLNNQITVLDLDRLNQSDTFTLANNFADHSLDPKLKSILYTITEGHPFFIFELISAVMPLPNDFTKQRTILLSTIPDKVRHVLEAHLNQLSPLARDVAEQASVIGRSFTYPVLSQLTHLREEELVNSLDECWQSQVIREEQQDTYEFNHNMLHEVTYESISLTRRRWLHRQVAKILESLHSEELGSFASIIADHYEKAGFIEQAISYYDLAYQTNSQVYAYIDALTASEKAISLIEQRPDKDRRHLAAFHERIGDINAITAQYHTAYQAYQSSSTYTQKTDIYEQARLAQKMGNVLKREGAEYEKIVDQYKQAAVTLKQDSVERDRIWWQAWCDLHLEQIDLHFYWNKAEIMHEHIESVQDEIRTYGTQVQKATFYKLLMFYRLLSNGFFAPEEAVVLAQKALETLPKSANLDIIASHQYALGFCHLWHGDYDKAIITLQEAYGLSEHCGDIMGQACSLAYLVLAYRLTDQQVEVEKSAQTCLLIAERARLSNYIGISKAGFAWLNLRCPNRKTPSNTALSETKHLAQQAITAWGKNQSPYPFQWQALLLLLYVAMYRNQLVEAVYYARKLCDPTQQVLKPEINEALTTALTAWNMGSRDKTREMLNKALTNAHQMNFL